MAPVIGCAAALFFHTYGSISETAASLSAIHNLDDSGDRQP